MCCLANYRCCYCCCFPSCLPICSCHREVANQVVSTEWLDWRCLCENYATNKHDEWHSDEETKNKFNQPHFNSPKQCRSTVVPGVLLRRRRCRRWHWCGTFIVRSPLKDFQRCVPINAVKLKLDIGKKKWMKKKSGRKKERERWRRNWNAVDKLSFFFGEFLKRYLTSIINEKSQKFPWQTLLGEHNFNFIVLSCCVRSTYIHIRAVCMCSVQIARPPAHPLR